MSSESSQPSAPRYLHAAFVCIAVCAIGLLVYLQVIWIMDPEFPDRKEAVMRAAAAIAFVFLALFVVARMVSPKSKSVEAPRSVEPPLTKRQRARSKPS